MAWQIKTNNGKCVRCEKSFLDEQHYVSNVSETEELLERQDFCLECWDAESVDGSVFFWKAVFQDRRKKSMFVDNETLMNFFLRLEEEDSQLKKNFRYLLALILMRKKVLLFKDVSKEGESSYLVLRDKEETDHMVLDPKLDESAIEEVKKQMMVVLNEDVFDLGEAGSDSGTSE